MLFENKNVKQTQMCSGSFNIQCGGDVNIDGETITKNTGQDPFCPMGEFPEMEVSKYTHIIDVIRRLAPNFGEKGEDGKYGIIPNVDIRVGKKRFARIILTDLP